MKQAIATICFALAVLIIFVSSLCYGEELLSPYCYGGVYCVETSILREPKNGLPPFGEMLFDIGCYINSWTCPHSVIWGGTDNTLTMGLNTSSSILKTDTIYLDAEQIKTICIKHLDATRCADSLLLWELISKMEETK